MFISRFSKNFKGFIRPVFDRQDLEYTYINKYEREKIKRQLEIDFEGKCGYCGWPDNLSFDSASFHIDHFNPKVKDIPELDKYKEYVYCCPVCNTTKRDRIIRIDPTTDLYNTVYYRNSSGTILVYNVLEREIKEIACEVRKTIGLDKEIHKIGYMIVMLNDIKDYISNSQNFRLKHADLYISLDCILREMNRIYRRKTYHIR